MKRFAALFLLALLLPAAAAAEKTEERVAQGIESVSTAWILRRSRM